MNELTVILIWAAVIGVIFVILWRKGYLLRMSGYVLETREELKKCTWPTYSELKSSTVVVMVTIAILGVFTVCIDYVISRMVAVLF